MKTLYIATASAAMLLLAASCSETYDIYPAEYDSIVRIKDGGYHDVNVYSVQDQTTYPITVTKGGLSPESMANATLRVMTKDEFDAYLLESGAGYSYIPNDCYAFTDGELDQKATLTFNPKDGYQVTNLTLYPPKIGEFLSTYTDTSRDPVIPIILESDDSRIDNNSCEMFIKPNYSRPIICFSGEKEMKLADGQDVANLRISLDGMASLWTMKCNIEVDPTILDEYNSTNHMSLGLMPEGSYTDVTDVTLNEGDEYAALNIELDLNKAAFRSALPLRITGVDVDGIELVNNTALVIIENTKDSKINLTENDLYSPDDAFTNETCTGYNGVGHDGTGVKALCDGIYDRWNDFFSSCYFQPHHYDETYNSYVEITLPRPAKAIAFDYSTRAYYNRRPHLLRIWAWNGSEWKQIGKDVDFKDAYVSFKPESGYTYEVSPVGAFFSDFEFSKVRFSVVKGNGGLLLSGVMHDYAHMWECGELVVYAK